MLWVYNIGKHAIFAPKKVKNISWDSGLFVVEIIGPIHSQTFPGLF